MKVPFRQKFSLLLMATGVLSCLLPIAQAQGLPRPDVRGGNAQRLTDITAAGLNHDMSQTNAIVLVLTNPPHPDFKKAALLALARLGAVEAEPTINSVIAGNDIDTSNYAKAALARLIAENTGQGQSESVAATAKIAALLQASGLTVTEINMTVANHYKNGGGSDGPQPIEIYALREVADMIYQDTNMDFTKVPAVSQLKFEQDYPALLKIKLSSLATNERIETIISDLADKKTLTTKDYYEMQLGVNYGLPASQAAAAQLHKMSTAGIQYSPQGFTALLQILHGVGDKDQAALFSSLMASENLEWMYPDIKNGIPHQITPGY
ncbi:MAG: hypothetical protein ACRYFS_21535 [Janthinobacterium lividum]